MGPDTLRLGASCRTATGLQSYKSAVGDAQDPGHAAPDQYKAFLNRQADVYEDQRRTGPARSRLYRVTHYGNRVLTAAISLHDDGYPEPYLAAA
jgi:hypothetical protein